MPCYGPERPPRGPASLFVPRSLGSTRRAAPVVFVVFVVFVERGPDM